jgi:hypothetical protein
MLDRVISKEITELREMFRYIGSDSLHRKKIDRMLWYIKDATSVSEALYHIDRIKKEYFGPDRSKARSESFHGLAPKAKTDF